MKYSILATALLLAACGGNNSDSTTNPVDVVTDDQPITTETSAPSPAPQPVASPEPMQQPTAPEEQATAITGPCVDTAPVGDGFGWNGVESCSVPATTVTSIPEPIQQPTQQPTVPEEQATATAGPCVDTAPVGDGFGWNGVASCTVPSTTVTPVIDVTPVMPPNDSTSVARGPRTGECVDADGDGIGSDRFTECRLSTPSDSSWAFCETDNNSPNTELEFGQTWGKQRDSSFETYACVRKCGSTAFELPNTPGWSYDPNADAECIVDVDSSDAFIEMADNVPFYDITADGTERQSFQDQFAYPLYYGNASWECSRETRQSNSEMFVAVGAPMSITFDDSSDGNWYFDRRQWKQTLTINDDSGQDGLFEYTGYAQIEHDSLTIYQNSYDRLSCDRLGDAPNATLPLNIVDFRNADNLLLDDLLDQSFQCQLLESLGRSENVSHDLGWSINTIQDTSRNRDLTFNPTFLTLNDAGEALYESTQGYLRTSTGNIDESTSPAFSGFQFSGNRFFRLQQGTSTFYGHLLAKKMGDNIILENYSFSRASGGGADEFSYYVCPVRS